MIKGRKGEIVLFEIPVYSMTEQAFHDKWKRRLDKAAERQLDSSAIDDRTRYSKQKQMTWLYNQIVGYITVNVTESIIFCNAYMRTNDSYTKEKRSLRFDSGRKPYMEDLVCSGFVIMLDEYQGEELKRKIKMYVEELISVYVEKQEYVDTSLFDATIDCVDIMKLIEMRKRQSAEEYAGGANE